MVQGILVICSVVENIQYVLEYVIWRNSIEECHTGASLDGINVTKYIYRKLSSVL